MTGQVGDPQSRPKSTRSAEHSRGTDTALGVRRIPKSGQTLRSQKRKWCAPPRRQARPATQIPSALPLPDPTLRPSRTDLAIFPEKLAGAVLNVKFLGEWAAR